MKKLMIAAAAAAMVSGAFAVGKAQVYDFSATIKTGICRETKVSRALATYFNHGGQTASVEAGQWQRGDEIALRKQQTMKIGGVMWGCDCDSIRVPYWGPARGYTRARYLSGYMFWNLTSEELYIPWTYGAVPNADGITNMITSFRWIVLNRIDAMTKCEGAFILRARWPGQELSLRGAGFGKVKNTGCDTIITSINGNIAGWRNAANEAFGCVFCATSGCTVVPLCDTCWDGAFGFADTSDWTAATGTWKIKYNSSVSKALARTPFISKVYKFPRKSGGAALFAETADRINAAFRGLTYAASDDDDDYADAYDFDPDGNIFGEEYDEDEAKEYAKAILGAWAEKPLDDVRQDFYDSEEIDELEAFEKSVRDADATTADAS